MSLRVNGAYRGKPATLSDLTVLGSADLSAATLLAIPQAATDDLPDPTLYPGMLAWDTTVYALKFSDGTAGWETVLWVE